LTTIVLNAFIMRTTLQYSYNSPG